MCDTGIRLSHSVYLRQFRNALDDLERTTLTEMDAEFGQRRWKRIVLDAIVLLLVVAGLIAFFRKLPPSGASEPTP